MKFLALALVLTACGSAPKPAPVVPVTTVALEHYGNIMAGLDPAKLTSGVPGIDKYTIRMADCGFWNAFAIHSEKEVVLCDVLVSSGPAVMRMVLLHEAGHVAFENGVAYTGMEELAADEYAIVRSVREGRRDDIDAVAKFWEAKEATHGLYFYLDYGYWDPHPSYSRRAWHARCLYIGSGPAPKKLWDLVDWYDCRSQWKRTKASWDKILP